MSSTPPSIALLPRFAGSSCVKSQSMCVAIPAVIPESRSPFCGHSARAPPNAFSVDIRVSAELNAAQPAFDPNNMFPILEKLGIPNSPANARNYRLPGPLVLSMLAQRLPPAAPEPAPPVELHLLVDGGTFSSAALFAILVRDNRLGMLVGEPTGNPPSFNASEIHLDIPHLPYFLNLSTARLIRPDVNAGPAETILPDVLAPMTADALAAGSDPALDWVRAR